MRRLEIMYSSFLSSLSFTVGGAGAWLCNLGLHIRPTTADQIQRPPTPGTDARKGRGNDILAH